MPALPLRNAPSREQSPPEGPRVHCGGAGYKCAEPSEDKSACGGRPPRGRAGLSRTRGSRLKPRAPAQTAPRLGSAAEGGPRRPQGWRTEASPSRGQPAPRAPRRSRAAAHTSSQAVPRGASAAGWPAWKALLGYAAPGPGRRARLPAPGRGRGGGEGGGKKEDRRPRWASGTRGPQSPRLPPARPPAPPATHLAVRGSHMAGTRRRRLGMRTGDTEAPRSEAGAGRKAAASRGSCGTGCGSAAQAESVLPRGCGGPRAVTYRRAAGEEGVAFAPRRGSRPAPPRGRGPRRGGPASGAESFAPGARDRGVGPRLELRLLGGQRRPAVVEAMARRARGGALPSGGPRRPLRRRRVALTARPTRRPRRSAADGAAKLRAARRSSPPSLPSSCHAGGREPAVQVPRRRAAKSGACGGRGGYEAPRNPDAHSCPAGWSRRLRGQESRSHPPGAPDPIRRRGR